MTNLQAYGFLVFGGLMHLLPLVAPGLFPPDGIDGANTSALWLQVMGWVNGATGAGYLLRLEILPFIAEALAWRPAPLTELLPDSLLRPALVTGAAPAADDAARSVAA
jgi:hypothetical protein